jgi:hypothetical protein
LTAIETIEGDFVLRSSLGRPLIRMHMTAETILITVAGQAQVFVGDISEVRQLRDWLTRRLDEPLE